ncbi:hypothetical protein TVAG_167660 [Trichomonas vaginalis G3]|uniref:Uncharacterized protein n=1 Tax=Trichomonas vaginalis (strain ATCC PRA-98 / G3) TaxID=412133 RepID=A2G2J5_TRIV3|nr:hypothetical protein TVAGG3_0918860 [Trichomonas vaginalis G3]EAX88619.1 hypothetical protein TVAG_167660 [Trichomonas vaginalis G3]KAI5485004.1 hypothetical protein TVAGG3_0918860 [Trichomonas vaginalis G3]|eukprot:XP_001301549.1 hypothetical protein [Trichomonas vaginalis G3]
MSNKFDKVYVDELLTKRISFVKEINGNYADQNRPEDAKPVYFPSGIKIDDLTIQNIKGKKVTYEINGEDIIETLPPNFPDGLQVNGKNVMEEIDTTNTTVKNNYDDLNAKIIQTNATVKSNYDNLTRRINGNAEVINLKAHKGYVDQELKKK